MIVNFKLYIYTCRYHTCVYIYIYIYIYIRVYIIRIIKSIGRNVCSSAKK